MNEMKAGRELDAKVAEIVMGLSVLKGAGWIYFANDEGGELCAYPDYSTNIAAAWLVVERMKERGWWLNLYEHSMGNWQAEFWGISTPERTSYRESDGDTAPEAICRAALAALEGEAK